ncbi:hypothetical protein I4U23_000190 [Adineta vaga]|nr:hypothetical protein I4U23_000190 [Adineta vaga]
MANGELGDINTMEQATVLSKQVIEHNYADVEQSQDILIVWLDSSIHNNNPDCQNTIKQLQQVVTDVHTFTDNDQCIEFILNTIATKVCMIVSGSVGQDIVPCIHDISKIDSIFIFCGNKNQHEQWVKPWFKIKGVFIDITHICQQLQQITRQYEHNTMPMSFMASGKRLDQLDPSFMYTQIIKEILLTITFEDKHIKEFVNYYSDSFVDNEIDRKKVKQLEHEYYQKTPIWWYTTERF